MLVKRSNTDFLRDCLEGPEYRGKYISSFNLEITLLFSYLSFILGKIYPHILETTHKFNRFWIHTVPDTTSYP